MNAKVVVVVVGTRVGEDTGVPRGAIQDAGENENVTRLVDAQENDTTREPPKVISATSHGRVNIVPLCLKCSRLGRHHHRHHHADA
ncbi:unnamed protein product [Lampetra planeri]